ncbi:MAG: hypothetical protein KC561_06290 [Myxococcales bacterium]|nr:hypothetical protein [Myxococcales bacterium]
MKRPSFKMFLGLSLSLSLAACAGTTTIGVTPNEVEELRLINLVPVDPGLELGQHASIQVGSEQVVFYNGSRDFERYAAVSADGGFPVWLDIADQASSFPESGWTWEDIEVTPDGSTLVGVIDWCIESPGHELYVVSSEDAGRTWFEISSVEKPHYFALFDSLELGEDTWTLGVSLDDCAGCGQRNGLTVYESTDRGRTWSAVD